VFSHSDASQAAVLIIVGATTPIATPAQRNDIVTALCLGQPAEKKGGI
jgi:energy-converting hydrogenase Eha subunit E